MKYILFTFSLIAAIQGHATAQIVKSEFLKKTDGFSTFITQKNIAGQDRTYDELNSMMKSQISFINSNIRTEQVKYVSDTTKVGTKRAKSRHKTTTTTTTKKTDDTKK